MILPGFPVMIAGGPAPFSLSGSWETGMEGWSVTGGNADRDRDSDSARSGDWFLYTSSGGTSTVDYVIDDPAGLFITASVYTRTLNGSSETRALRYRIGSGSFITLQSVTNNSMSYSQLSGGFASTPGQPVTIRLEDGGGADQTNWDDWAISGA